MGILKRAKVLSVLLGLTLLAIAPVGSTQATEVALLSGIVGTRAVLVVGNGAPQLLAVGGWYLAGNAEIAENRGAVFW
ncbi:MAG: hypothetical protein FWD67_05330 [Betaproteobacteria bacterium]|nr:hypothetical protein [Betaproteobacteria bacterium]